MSFADPDGGTHDDANTIESIEQFLKQIQVLVDDNHDANPNYIDMVNSYLDLVELLHVYKRNRDDDSVGSHFIRKLNSLGHRLALDKVYLPVKSVHNNERLQTCNYLADQYSAVVGDCQLLSDKKTKYYLKINFLKCKQKGDTNQHTTLIVYPKANANVRVCGHKVHLDLSDVNKCLIEFDLACNQIINLTFIQCQTFRMDYNSASGLAKQLHLPCGYFHLTLKGNENISKNFSEKFNRFGPLDPNGDDQCDYLNFEIFSLYDYHISQSLFLNNYAFFVADGAILSLYNNKSTQNLYMCIKSIDCLPCEYDQAYFIEIYNRTRSIDFHTYVFGHRCANDANLTMHVYSLDNDFFGLTSGTTANDDDDDDNEVLSLDLYTFDKNTCHHAQPICSTQRIYRNQLNTGRIRIRFEQKLSLSLEIEFVFVFEFDSVPDECTKSPVPREFFYFDLNRQHLCNNAATLVKHDYELFAIVSAFHARADNLHDCAVDSILSIRTCLYYMAYIRSRLLIVKANDNRVMFKQCLSVLNEILKRFVDTLERYETKSATNRINYADFYANINDLNKNLVINCLIDHLKEYNVADLNMLHIYLNLILHLTVSIGNNQNVKLIVKYELNNFFMKFLANYGNNQSNTLCNLNYLKIFDNFTLIYTNYDLYELICLKLLSASHVHCLNAADFFLNNIFKLAIYVNNFEFRDRILVFVVKLMHSAQSVNLANNFDLLVHMLDNRLQINKKHLDDVLKMQFKTMLRMLSRQMCLLNVYFESNAETATARLIDLSDFHKLLQAHICGQINQLIEPVDANGRGDSDTSEQHDIEHLKKLFLCFVDSLDFILKYSTQIATYLDSFGPVDFLCLFDLIDKYFTNRIDCKFRSLFLLNNKINRTLYLFVNEIKAHLIKFISKLMIANSCHTDDIEFLLMAYFKLIHTMIRHAKTAQAEHNAVSLRSLFTSTWLIMNAHFKKSYALGEYLIISVFDLDQNESLISFFHVQLAAYLKYSFHDVCIVLTVLGLIKNKTTCKCIDQLLLANNDDSGKCKLVANLCANYLMLADLNHIQSAIVVFGLFKVVNEIELNDVQFPNTAHFKYMCQVYLLKCLYKLYESNKSFYEMAIVSKCIGDLYEKYESKSTVYEDLKAIFYLKSLKKFNFGLLNQLQLSTTNLSQLNVCKLEAYLARIETNNCIRLDNDRPYGDFLAKLQRIIRTVKDLNSINKNQITNMHYRIGFFGAYTLATIKNKYFLYSHTNHDILSNIQTEFLQLFDNKPIILNYNQEPNKHIKDNNDNTYLQICTLKVITKRELLELVSNGLNDVENAKTVEHIGDVLKNYGDAYRLFYCDKPFYKSALYTPIECIENLWIERNIFIANHVHEDFLKLNEIKHNFKLFLNPIFNAVNDINDKTRELKDFLLKFNVNSNYADNNGTRMSAFVNIVHNMQPLTMRLLGCLDAPIHGGLMVYIKQFLNEKYLNTLHFNSKNKRKILVYNLYGSIKRQLMLLESCLSLHNRLLCDLDKQLAMLQSDLNSDHGDNSILDNYENMKKLNEHLVKCLHSVQNELYTRWMNL